MGIGFNFYGSILRIYEISYNSDRENRGCFGKRSLQLQKADKTEKGVGVKSHVLFELSEI